MGHFDGDAQSGHCGGGMTLTLNKDHHFILKMGCGEGNNTRDELLTLWDLLKFVSNVGAMSLQVLGDKYYY